MSLRIDGKLVGGGGSGSGGHTILDDNGTALAQEDNLQFVGAFSEDDSTNSATKVNVYREMTRAEFDLLSEDEKAGFIRVTDEADIVSIVDGVFIDTDNVIVDIASYGNDAPIPNYTAIEDCYIRIYVMGKSEKTTTINVNSKAVSNAYFASNDGSQTISLYLKKGQILSISSEGYWNINYTVYGIQTGSKVIKYNYSTSEHIVGTWVNGKPIYERSINLAQFDITLNDNEWQNLMAIPNADFLCGAEVSGQSPNTTHIVRFWIDNGYLKGASKTSIYLPNFSNSGVYATIRYTKSTS